MVFESNSMEPCERISFNFFWSEGEEAEERSRQNVIFQFEPRLSERGNISQQGGFGTIVVDPAAEDNRATVDDDGAAFCHVS